MGLVGGMPDETGIDDDLIAMTPEQAAKLTGLSSRQLWYWWTTGWLSPSIDRKFSLRNHVRLYTFRDLVSLLVAARLRAAGFPTRYIRTIVQHLQSLGYERPLSELKFAVAGREIYFQYPDATWSGGRDPGQIIMWQVIPLEPIYARIRAATRRPAESAGRIERRRGAQGSRPVFAGTRIPVDVVVRRLQRGLSAESVIEAYPDLTMADVEAARRQAASA